MFVFIIFIPILGLLLLMLNLIFAPHNPYQEKYSIFECGFHSFLGQNRTQFGIKFFIFALVYLLLDLEIVLTFPFAVSEYINNIYGLIITLIFIIIITIGFIYELGRNALKIESRQDKKNIILYHKAPKLIKQKYSISNLK
jgi:NADH-ubiquinone oxidoreductase chain 3